MASCEVLSAGRCAPVAAAEGTRADDGRRPCFFFRDCGRLAEVEKQGKAVCRGCARTLVGTEYPLRPPVAAPLYDPEEEAELAVQTGLVPAGRRLGRRCG